MEFESHLKFVPIRLLSAWNSIFAMKRPSKRTLVFLGLGLVIIGLGLHTEGALLLWKNYYYQIAPGENYAEALPILPKFGEDSINLCIFASSQSSLEKFTAVFVNVSEYGRFEDGAALTELVCLASIDMKSTMEGYNITEVMTSVHFPQSGLVYLIIKNNDSANRTVSFWISAISPLYYVGLVVAICGTFCILATLAWFSSGWKRYLVIGVGVNFIAFFTRIAMFTTYLFPDSLYSGMLSPEMYDDFLGWYNYFVVNFPWTLTYTPGSGYIYPPLFVTTLATFWFLPLPLWRLAIPLFATNIITGYLIYKITFKLRGNERGATWAMMLFYINPFTLLYGSFMWLNPSLFVCFVMLAFYLTLSQKHGQAMVVLGIGTMFKQFAVVFFPFLLLIALKVNPAGTRRGTLKEILKLGAKYLAPLVLVSLPSLIYNAPNYLQSVLFWNFGDHIDYLTTYPVPDNWPITFISFFSWIGTPSPVTTALVYLLQYFVLLGGCAIAIYGSFWAYSMPKGDSTNDSGKITHVVNQGLILAMLLVICLDIFYPRGSYKFYLMLLTPFVSIFYDTDDFTLTISPSASQSRFRTRFLIPTLLSWIIFWCNRYLYFPILVAWLLYFVVKQHQLKQSRVEKLTLQENVTQSQILQNK